MVFNIQIHLKLFLIYLEKMFEQLMNIWKKKLFYA